MECSADIRQVIVPNFLGNVLPLNRLHVAVQNHHVFCILSKAITKKTLESLLKNNTGSQKVTENI